jgi:hypothetical protein
MLNAAVGGVTTSDRGLEGSDSDARIHRPADRIADDLSRPSVEDGDVDQVRYQKLVRAIGNDTLCQISENWPGVIAVSRDDIAPTLFGLQVVLAHQAAQLLVVNHHTLMA